MSGGIDFNAGTSIRKHAGTGSYVCMQKDKPGVYMDRAGRPVDDATAREAGFDVEADRSAARRVHGRELARQRARAALPEEKTEVVAQRGRYQVVAHGLGQFTVDRDGQPITPLHLSKREALRLLSMLAPSPSERVPDQSL